MTRAAGGSAPRAPAPRVPAPARTARGGSGELARTFPAAAALLLPFPDTSCVDCRTYASVAALLLPVAAALLLPVLPRSLVALLTVLSASSGTTAAAAISEMSPVASTASPTLRCLAQHPLARILDEHPGTVQSCRRAPPATPPLDVVGGPLPDITAAAVAAAAAAAAMAVRFGFLPPCFEQSPRAYAVVAHPGIVHDFRIRCDVFFFGGGVVVSFSTQNCA